ncbi:MAG: hypothetical protein AABY22_15815 [Nanoarchaeota archaeon]
MKIRCIIFGHRWYKIINLPTALRIVQSDICNKCDAFKTKDGKVIKK